MYHFTRPAQHRFGRFTFFYQFGIEKILNGSGYGRAADSG
jgi:hypothetical protein